jgi:pimeloyl-ACP methyl ester carboxylesterase
MFSIRRITFFIATAICLICASYAQERVTFRSPDKVPITADLYVSNPASAPFIILFHQAKYSRGEFGEIAPKLNGMGFNCIAVDLRSGGTVNGIRNETFNYADSLRMKTRYVDAYGDMRSAVSYVRSKYPSAKVILLGSSYSAALSLKLAGDFPKGISGVAAFSPGEYFSVYGWSRDIIKVSSTRIKCPVFITSSKTETDEWKAIYDAIPVATKTSFVPVASGKHGAKALWSNFPENTEYWKALKAFLNQFK